MGDESITQILVAEKKACLAACQPLLFPAISSDFEEEKLRGDSAGEASPTKPGSAGYSTPLLTLDFIPNQGICPWLEHSMKR
jgi:hypothetical protein